MVGLYNNIPNNEGLIEFRKALDSRRDKKVSTDFLIDLLDLVLTLNISEFDKKLFLQLIGTATGTDAAPTYANIFMASVDKWLEECSFMDNEDLFKGFIIFLKRFIDDYLIFWSGSEDDFKLFMIKINKIHPTIKFTSSYNIQERSTNFLDLKITITDSGIITDLYRKETDRVQYVLPSSCHPSHVFNNIPYSLALRLVRICSEQDTLLTRMQELKEMLLSRMYNKNIVNAALKRALETSREEALKRVEKKKKKDRVTFVVTYNPKQPTSISGIAPPNTTKHPYATKPVPKPVLSAPRQNVTT